MELTSIMSLAAVSIAFYNRIHSVAIVLHFTATLALFYAVTLFARNFFSLAFSLLPFQWRSFSASTIFGIQSIFYFVLLFLSFSRPKYVWICEFVCGYLIYFFSLLQMVGGGFVFFVPFFVLTWQYVVYNKYI